MEKHINTIIDMVKVTQDQLRLDLMSDPSSYDLIVCDPALWNDLAQAGIFADLESFPQLRDAWHLWIDMSLSLIHIWGSSVIVSILKKREYLGHTINFKTRKHFKDKKSHYVHESEWSIFENTHEMCIRDRDHTAAYLSSDETIAAQLSAAQTAYESLTALKAQLDQINTFVTGLKTYTDGVAQAAAGASQLHTGLTQLNAGAATLSTGAAALSTGAASLSEGADSLLSLIHI